MPCGGPTGTNDRSHRFALTCADLRTIPQV